MRIGRLSHIQRVAEFRKLMHQGKPKLAERAVKELGNLGDEAIPALRDALHGSPWQRRYAIDAIVKIKPRLSVGLVGDLRRIAAHDTIKDIRAAAENAANQLTLTTKKRA